MSKTIKKEKFLQLMQDMGSHSVYYPEPIAKDLNDCGISTDAAPNGEVILIEGHLIPVWEPE